MMQQIFNECKVCNKSFNIGDRVVHCDEGIVMKEMHPFPEEIMENGGKPILGIETPDDSEGKQFSVHVSCLVKVKLTENLKSEFKLIGFKK
jgi:hypothetical protein